MTSTPKEPPQEVQDYIKSHFSYRDGMIDGMLKQDVGSIHYRGKIPYKRIEINYRGDRYRIYRSHLVYFLCRGFWPALEIDHEDRNSLNDKIENLRMATKVEQNLNRGNYSGYFEVDKTKDGKYRVRNKRTKQYLGRYFTREEAYEAIDEWLARGSGGVSDTENG